jgi:hypothetical protein
MACTLPNRMRATLHGLWLNEKQANLRGDFRTVSDFLDDAFAIGGAIADHRTRRTGSLNVSEQDCPHDCPCARPEPAVQGQQQPTRAIDEVVEPVGFAPKDRNGREQVRRLANRRLQLLGHLTADAKWT